jgi:hypothetical protein
MFERNAASLVESIKRARILQMTNEDIYYKAKAVAEGVLDTLASYTILMAQAATDYPPPALLERLQSLLQQFASIGLHGKEVFQVQGRVMHRFLLLVHRWTCRRFVVA